MPNNESSSVSLCPFFFSPPVIISLSQRFVLSRRLVRWRHAAAVAAAAAAPSRRAQISLLINSHPVWKIPRARCRADEITRKTSPSFAPFTAGWMRAVGARLFDVRRGLLPSRPRRHVARIAFRAACRPLRIHAPFCPVVRRRLSLPSAPRKKELGRMSACRASSRDWIARVAAHSASSRRGVNSKRRNLRSARPIIGLLILICARVTCNGWSARPAPPAPPTRRQTERRARAENAERRSSLLPPRE